MKGYWINHVVEIRDSERFGAYAEASAPLFQGDNKYGAKMLMFGPAVSTVLGDPVQHAAMVEFDSVQAAIDFWDDPDYAATRALMGPTDDETSVVERRVCCIEAEPLLVSPGQGFWLNHVHKIFDESAFFSYAEASMPQFTGASFGPVVHQHAGEQQVELAAALGFQNVATAIDIYKTPEYQSVLGIGGMAEGESKVVNRTICAIEVSE